MDIAYRPGSANSPSDVTSFDEVSVREPSPHDVNEASSTLRTPINIQTASIGLLAVFATVFVLQWGSAVWIPLMISVMISYALSPLVDRMQKWHIPRALAAGIILISIVGGFGALLYSLIDDANELIRTLPEAAKNFRDVIRAEQGATEGPIEKVQDAAAQIEKTARETVAAAPAPSTGVMRVQIEEPKFEIKDYFWHGTMGLAGFIGQTGIVCFLVYFLLASGDTFRRKLAKIAGPTLTKKKITLQVLNEITVLIQRYLLVQLFTSVLVGVVSWFAFEWIGLEHAALWGIAAGVLNSVPYVGPVIVTGGTSLVALLQFGTVDMALLVGGVSLLITSLEGYLLTPWLTGRASRMSPVVVFVSVLFWGWLWGVWGLLLGVPIVMIVKSICDHVEDLKPIGELLGDYSKTPLTPALKENSP